MILRLFQLNGEFKSENSNSLNSKITTWWMWMWSPYSEEQWNYEIVMMLVYDFWLILWRIFPRRNSKNIGKRQILYFVNLTLIACSNVIKCILLF